MNDIDNKINHRVYRISPDPGLIRAASFSPAEYRDDIMQKLIDTNVIDKPGEYILIRNNQAFLYTIEKSKLIIRK